MESVWQKRLIICCGSGGVGKTTLAATLALEAAHRGKKAIVLTIDPAKRLASALGLRSFLKEPKQVPLRSAGTLHAMMLDTKQTFDHLIEKYISSPVKRKSILENRLYQQMSSLIAGSQEYMAIEKLYELAESSDFDFLVLDTPPSQHALDFLEAPQRMIRITSNSLLEWFLKPGLWTGKIGFGFLKKGTDRLLAVFDQLAGFSFLHELSEMLGLIAGLFGGFQKRAQVVYDLLRSDSVGFLLVTTPHREALKDSLQFYRKLEKLQFPFLGFLINRVIRSCGPSPMLAKATLSPGLFKKLQEVSSRYQLLAERDEEAVRWLKKEAGRGVFYQSIPLSSEEVTNLDGLERLTQLLPGAGR